MFCFVLLFALLPTNIVSELVNIGNVGGRRHESEFTNRGNTPREECDLKFPSGGTVNISTLPQEINGKATWVGSDNEECGNAQIDQRPENGRFQLQSTSCIFFCNLVPCGLYSSQRVHTLKSQIQLLIQYLNPQSVKSFWTCVLYWAV
jgi:hypothetical protein